MKSVHTKNQIHTITIELNHIELASFIATLNASIELFKSNTELGDMVIEVQCLNLNRLKSAFTHNSTEEN